jgi:excisionase family DNA binding protein
MPKLRQDAPLLSVPEVAERLAVSSSTVRRLIASGSLPAVRIGGQVRVDRSELFAYVFGPEAASAAGAPPAAGRKGWEL